MTLERQLEISVAYCSGRLGMRPYSSVVIVVNPGQKPTSHSAEDSESLLNLGRRPISIPLFFVLNKISQS